MPPREYTDAPRAFGELVSQHRDSESTFYHFDPLGSTAALTDLSQTVTDSYIYGAFGEVTASTGGTTNPYQWVGQAGYYHDETAGLYSLRRRDYTASEGRFLSQDPIGLEAGDANFYRYVRNNSINSVDPSGLEEPTNVKIPQFTTVQCHAPATQQSCTQLSLSGFQGLPELESEDELKQNFSVIFQRLKKQEPDVLGFMTKYHVEIEARDYYWNEFLGGRPNALRRETTDGEFEVVIQVPPDASDYVIFDYVVRSIKRQPLFKEYYDSLPNQPALSVPITQAPIDRLGAFIVGDEERLRRFRKEQYMLNAGATEGEISEVRWTAFIQDVLGSGGIAENALCTIAGSQILRPKVTIVTGTPKPVPTLKVKPCSPYDAARQVRIRWKQPTTNATHPNTPPPKVTAKGTVNGKTFTDTNQSARVGGDPNKPTLIECRVKEKQAKDKKGKKFPNANMADAHAEIGVIQQAYDAGVTKGGDMVMTVTGEPVCGYCLGDIAAAAQEAGLRKLTLNEVATGKTLYWEPGWKNLREESH